MPRLNSTIHLFRLKPSNQKITPTKATGPDLITAQMIQELPPGGQETLLQLYNAMLRLEYWPTEFKKSKGSHDSKTWEAAHRRHLTQAYQPTTNHLKILENCYYTVY